MRIDVLIFGGGAAGLWCLDRFRRAGYHAILLESRALGAGQTIQAQGIIHGGGKYALRGVRDFAAVRAVREMPERWRRSLAGATEPNLAGVRVLSDRCHLWLPRGSLVARIQAWGFLSVVAHAGLLSARLEKLSKPAWPPVLLDSALAVYSLPEPVVSTGSLLEALAARHRDRIFSYDTEAIRSIGDAVRISEFAFRPRAIVLAAGEGNADLLQRNGTQADLMQRRPLGMVLLRGPLPPLFGHCVVGGKTMLTITAPAQGVWQVGGEIAERLANEENTAGARSRARIEIGRWLPGLDFSAVRMALYRAIRAEARTAELRRPSGVHALRVASRLFVAWPTKLALAPILADEVFALVSTDLKGPAGYEEDKLPPWTAPPVARYPWEEVEWFPAL